MVRIGVLALQGCVQQHLDLLSSEGAHASTVRRPIDLEGLHGLILPGGESSTMLRLMQREGLFVALKRFCTAHPAWGVCAGAILLAKEVSNPSQPSLQIIDIRVIRNFYGSQQNSFHASLEIPTFKTCLETDFIRAPKLEPLHSDVQVLATYKGSAVLVQQGFCFASSFHPELSENPALHQYLIALCKEADTSTAHGL